MVEHPELYEPFLERAYVAVGGEVFLPSPEALLLVDYCDELGLAIIGLDGARITPLEKELYLDAISDASSRELMPWSEFRIDRSSFARKCLRMFIAEKGSETYFSFVVVDEAEYAEIMNSAR